MKRTVVQHIAGVTGQAASVLPLLLVTIFLSNVEGLEVAGRFTVLVGASAAIFSISLWGLRSLVQLDQFATIAADDLLGTRLVAIVVASAAVVGVAVLFGASWPLVSLIVFMRSADSIIDLRFAMTQVWSSTQPAITQYAGLHLAKLCFVGLAIGIGAVGLVSFEIAAVVASLVAVVLAIAGFAGVLRRNAVHSIRLRRIPEVLRAAFWFALAAGICAVVTSAPRFSLPWMYEGDQLGVIGVTLSVSTFFGMAFYTTWVRHVTDFRNNFGSTAVRFLVENLVIATLLLVASWLILPPIVAFVFGYSEPQQSVTTKWVLLTSVLFFAGMNSCNLYKASRLPWMESLSYALTFVVVALAYAFLPQVRSTPVLLVIAAVVLLSSGLGAIVAGSKAESHG